MALKSNTFRIIYSCLNNFRIFAICMVSMFMLLTLKQSVRAATCPESCTGNWEGNTLSRMGAISAIESAPDGRLFVALRNNGLRIYESNDNGVYEWTSITVSGRGLTSNNITDLAIFNDALWIGTSDAGVCTWHLVSGTWGVYNTNTSPLPGNSVNRLTTVPAPPDVVNPNTTDFSIWVSTREGAAHYHYIDPPTLPGLWLWGLMDESYGLPADNVYDVGVHFVGDLRYTWFGTGEGLVRWDGQTVLPYTGSCQLTTANRIIVDEANRIWFNALKEVPTKDTTYEQAGLCMGIKPPRGFYSWTGFEDRYGYDMSVDPAGRLWLGNRENPEHKDGAWMHDQDRWCVFQKPGHGIWNNSVSAVHALGERTWFGHDTSAVLSSYSPNWEDYTGAELNSAGIPGAVLLLNGTPYAGVGSGFSEQLSDGSWKHTDLAGNTAEVTSIFQSGSTFFVGTAGNGLFELFLPLSTTTHWTSSYGFPNDNVRAVVDDKQNRVWVGTAGGLALKANGYWLNFTSGNSPLPGDDVRALTVDALGCIWIGTGSHGLVILDPDAGGNSGWITQTTTDGLPSNSIRSLVTDSVGGTWAGTTAGVGRWDPSTEQWTTYNKAGGALPGDTVLSLAADEGGRLWVGTVSGLALFQAGEWTHYHVPGTKLGSDRVRYLATNGDLLMASAGDTLSIRTTLTGPLGNFEPEIYSFTPQLGEPWTDVTVTGNHFDDRGPAYNFVYVGANEAGTNNPAVQATVISVTSTTLVFKVPPLAETGKIRIISHCLEAESADTFDVVPRVTGFIPQCVGLGDWLNVYGAGFSNKGAADVKIGDGDWRTVLLTGGKQKHSMLRLRILPMDTSGYIYVRTGNGKIGFSNTAVTIGSIKVDKTRVQQAIEGMPLVWGKRTLIHLDFTATECGGHITSGKLWWRKKGGDTVPGGIAYMTSPGGISIRPKQTAPATVDVNSTGVDFIAEFSSNRSEWTDYFPLNEFDGVMMLLENNGIAVLVHSLPASAFNFIHMGTPLNIRCMAVLPSGGGGMADFWDVATEGMRHCARMYPQPDLGALHGPNVWLSYTPIYITRPWVEIGEEGNGTEVREYVSDYLDLSPGNVAMALVDDNLYKGGSGGCAPVSSFFDGDGEAIAFNYPGAVGRLIAHECGHTLGLTPLSATNCDPANGHHSKYDEGVSHSGGSDPACIDAAHLTFWMALHDQLGDVKNVYRLDSGPPELFPYAPCDNRRPKSVMSYAPGRNNLNVFFEPMEYQYLFNVLKIFSLKSGKSGKADDPVLHLNGRLNQSGQISVTLSYVDTAEVSLSTPAVGAQYLLQLRSGGGSVLSGHPFSIITESGEGPMPTSPFRLIVPFGENTAKVEIRKEGELMWSRIVSEAPPQVSIQNPSGGTYKATEEVMVSWTASDPDGGSLQFALDYTPDNGDTWHRLPQYLTGNSYEWIPGFLPPSDSARIRIRASDGFHTAFAMSEPFRLLPRSPLVFFSYPEEGQVFTEGARVDLSVRSMTANGFNRGTFEWTVDEEIAEGNGDSLQVVFDTAGTHVIQVKVTESGETNSAEVSIKVIPDYDHDGLPNDWEQENGLNPMDLDDATLDADGDGLSNIGEYGSGTDPQDPDSDNDGVQDGEEYARYSDPGDLAWTPVEEPVLRVGAGKLIFTVEKGEAASESKSFWITNLGGGDLFWTAQTEVPWIDSVPFGGEAPTEVTLACFSEDLEIGTYSGDVVFRASDDAHNSPQTVEVILHVVKSQDTPPEGSFIRGDANADGIVNIADTIRILGRLFASGEPFSCDNAADANDDNALDISDAITILLYLFGGNDMLHEPFEECGVDITGDVPDCVSFPPCE